MPQPFALIAGAGPGLGLAIARRFAREGFRIALIVRPADAATLAEDFPEGSVLAADLADPVALETALCKIEVEAGFPGVLIYNAAAGTRGPLAELSAETLQREFQVNLLSALACVQWALPAMAHQGRGTILVSGGGLAFHPKPGEGGPALGKAAQRSLALGLASELAPRGIHVATVTIAGWLQPGTPFSPETAANEYWRLHAQDTDGWEQESILEP